MRKSKGLGTVIGTVIFLLIALAVIGTLLLISFRATGVQSPAVAGSNSNV